MADRFQVAITTAFALVEQFQQAISSPVSESSVDLSAKDALPLLSASSSALKAQVTKLSLLTITTPFTHSAITSVLTDLNESVLPSIATAALLITPVNHTKAFQNEVQVLTKTALKEISLLLEEVQIVANQNKEAKKANSKGKDLSQSEKDAVTVAAGRVWNGCDVLIDVAERGVVGFIIKRVEEWRDLVRDAIEEIEEWDPDNDEDDFFDELLSDSEKPRASMEGDDPKSDEDTTMLHEQKKSTLRMLKPVVQLYPAIVTHRLKKVSETHSIIQQLELLMIQLQPIPDHVDEVAGALYEADWPKHKQYLRKVKKRAVDAVSLAIVPLTGSQTPEAQSQAGGKFESWSKTWLVVLDEVSKFVGKNGESPS